ncbi:MAG: hypothetical protein U0271_25965 [Polyangiaceae bacterium]
MTRSSPVLIVAALVVGCGSTSRDGSTATSSAGPSTSTSASSAPSTDVAIRDHANPAKTSLSALVELAAVGSDEPFRGVLEKALATPDSTAPGTLRRWISSFEILRMSMSQAYRWVKDHHELLWYFDEIGVPGTVDDVTRALTAPLEAAGLTRRPAMEERLVYTRAPQGFTERVELESPRAWMGGRRDAAGTRVTWTVVGQQAASAPPTLAEVYAALPALRDERVDDVVGQLGAIAVTDVFFGGGVARYATTTIDLDCETGGKAALAALERAGFTPTERDTPANRDLSRPRTGSYAQLSRSEEGCSLHLQPES